MIVATPPPRRKTITTTAIATTIVTIFKKPSHPIHHQIHLKIKHRINQLENGLMISETKLDDSFPEAQFYIEGFRAPFRLDRNKHGGGILLYVRNNINAILLTDHVFPNDIEAFFTEIKVNTRKWLVCCSYNPNRINVSTHLEQV